eukprot:TRINITY_DN1494_c0_g1_i2.p1 TRINITY_DN1494_c0_g1~~TRINITY_DN1494_c0_g1_i2.p1  ORF type:complete len:1350 (-),score=374.83 TRINITY_DN1494_c0_g1_i2:182-4231(-)
MSIWQLPEPWVWDEGDPEDIYYLEEEIASGTFGSVYKSQHNETGEWVALKIMQPEEDDEDEVSQMVELWILKQCQHPNISKLLGTWQCGTETFIAMEYCGGGAVSDFYAVWGVKPTEDQIRLICYETLLGLQYLHDMKFIHRDIKGANILLSEDGHVKIIDFGVSAVLKDPAEKRRTLIGTPYFMAPEIISNKTRSVPYDKMVDVWSLGITLIELAEKDPPLSQMNPMRALMQIPLREPPSLTAPDEWTPEFSEFLTLCLSREPRKRASLERLMDHAWLQNLPSRDVLLKLIADAHRARELIIASEASGSDGLTITGASPATGDISEETTDSQSEVQGVIDLGEVEVSEDTTEDDSVRDSSDANKQAAALTPIAAIVPPPEESSEVLVSVESASEDSFESFSGVEDTVNTDDSSNPKPVSETSDADSKSAHEGETVQEEIVGPSAEEKEGDSAEEVGEDSAAEPVNIEESADEKTTEEAAVVVVSPPESTGTKNVSPETPAMEPETKKVESEDVQESKAASSGDDHDHSVTKNGGHSISKSEDGEDHKIVRSEVLPVSVTSSKEKKRGSSKNAEKEKEAAAKEGSKFIKVNKVEFERGSRGRGSASNPPPRPSSITPPNRRKPLQPRARPMKGGVRIRPQMNATATLHEQNLVKLKISNRQLMKQQLKALRMQASKHDAEMERLQGKMKVEERKFTKKHSEAASKLATRNESRLSKLAKAHTAELAAFEKTFADARKKVLSLTEDKEKKVPKEVSHLQDTRYSEYKKETKKLIKEQTEIHKDEVKKEKGKLKTNVPKKQRSAAEKSLKEDSSKYVQSLSDWSEMRLLRYRVEQAAVKFNEETSLAIAGSVTVHEMDVQHILDSFEPNALQMGQLRNLQLELFRETHQLEREHLQALQPLLKANRRKAHELEMVHLAKQQQVEQDQQTELLLHDQRAEAREFAKQKANDEKVMLRTVKVFKQQHRKTMSSKQIKDRQAQLRADWYREQEQKERDFLKEQKSQQQEEEALLRGFHQSQTERVKETYDEAIKEMVDDFKVRQKALDESLKRGEHSAELRYWQDMISRLKKCHDDSAQLLQQSSHMAQNLLVAKKVELMDSAREVWSSELSGLCNSLGWNGAELKDVTSLLNQFSSTSSQMQNDRFNYMLQYQGEELIDLQYKQLRERKLLLKKCPFNDAELAEKHAFSVTASLNTIVSTPRRDSKSSSRKGTAKDISPKKDGEEKTAPQKAKPSKILSPRARKSSKSAKNVPLLKSKSVMVLDAKGDESPPLSPNSKKIRHSKSKRSALVTKEKLGVKRKDDDEKSEDLSAHMTSSKRKGHRKKASVDREGKKAKSPRMSAVKSPRRPSIDI